MPNKDLVDTIKFHLDKGEQSENLKQFLINEGWKEGEIEEAFESIPKTPAKSLLSQIFPQFSPYLKEWDAKSARLPTGVLIGIFGVIIATVFIIAIFLYYLLDPLGANGVIRDKEREAVFSQIQTAVKKYYDKNNLYPKTLSELVPAYLTTVPLDPQTHKQYDYKLIEDNANFQFCMIFETRPVQCVTSATSSPIPVVTAPPDSVPATEITATPPEVNFLKGFAFLDNNQNGVKDENEPTFNGVSFTVTDSGGQTVCNPATDISGSFSCSISKPGTYQVMMSVPNGYKATLKNPQTVTFPADPAAQPAKLIIFGLAPIGSLPLVPTRSALGAR